jgi:phospholipid/cholesterol/gamma-HCH transport system substrate-binding protein
VSQRTIEVRVGILILLSLALLAGFIVVMGGLSLEPNYTVNVEFDNPGGLKSGAPVRLAGVKIGRVAAIEFKSENAEQKTGATLPLIRVVTKIENKYQKSIHTNSRWFVTTQGVLGELFLSVDPGTGDQPILADNATVAGISPPRLDLLLSESYEILHKTYLGITQNEEKLKETFDGLYRTLKGSGNFFEKNSGKLDNLVANLEQLSVQANETLLAARERYVDGKQVSNIMNNVEQTTTVLNENITPITRDGRKVLSDLSRVTDALANEEQVERYARLATDLSELTSEARAATHDARDLINHVKSGKGTIGALVMDEALYDDVQELLRDLKHNPWKFFWKE